MKDPKTEKFEKYPESFHLIRFPDCDPFGHLNNARYLDYFMNAREDHLRNYYGLDIYHYFDTTGKGWVIGSNEIIYRKPAVVMEEVRIQSQVREFSLTHIEVEMLMSSKDGKVLHSLLRSNIIPFDQRTGKATSHSDELMEMLEAVRIDSPTIPIRERMMQIEGNAAKAK